MTPPEQGESGGTRESLEAARREKLRKLEQLGVDPWGSRFDDALPIARSAPAKGRLSLILHCQINQAQTISAARHSEQHGPRVRAAGRIMLLRDTGKLLFIDLKDQTGRIQLYLGKKQVGERTGPLPMSDLGDIIGVDGELSIRKKGS